MINQYWQKPHTYNPEDAPLTVKDWNQSLAPMINSEIINQQSSIQIKVHDIERTYVPKYEYDTLKSQYYGLEARFNEMMEVIAIKGLLTEDDLKEFRESRKLAQKMAEEAAKAASGQAGFISANDKTKLGGIASGSKIVFDDGKMVITF